MNLPGTAEQAMCPCLGFRCSRKGALLNHETGLNQGTMVEPLVMRYRSPDGHFGHLDHINEPRQSAKKATERFIQDQDTNRGDKGRELPGGLRLRGVVLIAWLSPAETFLKPSKVSRCHVYQIEQFHGFLLLS